MSQDKETQIMSDKRYQVKRLMDGVLTRFDRNVACMKMTSLWKDLQSLHHLLLDVHSYIGDCGRQNQFSLMEEMEEKVHLIPDFLDEVLDWAKNEPDKDINALALGLRRKVSRPLSSSSLTSKNKSLSEKCNEISSSLRSLIDKSEACKLQKGVIPGSDLSFRPQLELQKPRFLEKMEVIGRSEELDQLINMLVKPGKDDESPLQIVPIVGEEGIGKTTLAWDAYDHRQIKTLFDHRIWVSASASADAKDVLENILEELAPNMRFELESVDEIIAVLLKELEGKSFFLVIDDVTGNKVDLPRLKLLKGCLMKLNTTRRNKIVITTNSTETAKEMDVRYQLHLKKLSDNDSKKILQKTSGGIQIKDIEESIALTGGIPLGVKVLGSTIYNLKHLQRKKEPDINHLLHADLVRKQEEDAPPTSVALNLSYLHLPQEVQQCFAYMSIFPPNTAIEKGSIIQLWMAHEFVQTQEDIEMEDTLEGCLNILLNSCLIEPSEIDFYRNIRSVKLARVAWELASNKLRLHLNEAHVSIYAEQTLVQASDTAELHTFCNVGNIVSYGKYHFGSLKVLNLSNSQFTEWPDAFQNMGHLRYIDVSGTKVAELPESITKLNNLQTIRAINCTYLERLPKDLFKLKELRHLCIDADNEAIRKCDMALALGTLTSLQTLPLIVVRLVTKDPQTSLEVLRLRPPVNLRGKMTACNLEHLTLEEAEEWHLNKKTGIDELIYEWSVNSPLKPIDNEVLEKLQPNVTLKGLTLKNFPGSKITMWKNVNSSNDTALLRNLVKLKLSNCNNCENLPTLGTQPCLTELHLEGMEKLESVGPELYTDKITGTTIAEESGEILFPVLRKLTLMYLTKLKFWSTGPSADNKVFPLLEELRVEGCDELVSTPSHFPSLTRLHVESVSSGDPLAFICSNLTTLESVFISSVPNLKSFPERILRNNSNLSSLRIWNCHKLAEIPNPDIWGCSNSLRSLSINECENLKTLPENLQKATSLTELIVSQCNSLKSIPSVDGLCCLRRLKIEWCNGLESLPSGLQSCISLEHLAIKGCPSLISVQDEGLSKLTSLCSVNIQGCVKLTALPLRELLHYLKKLERLEIEGFTEDPLGLTIEYPGLKGWVRFKALPKPLQTQKIKGAWTIDPKLLETFATKAVGFLEAMHLFETGVKAITQ